MSPARVQPTVDDDDEVSCAICLLETPATPLHRTRCEHVFCRQCLGAYAGTIVISQPVPCPLCRAPLAPDDLPSSFTLMITWPDDVHAPLGLTFAAGDFGGGPPRILSVTPNSPAARAGMRANMGLLQIGDEAVRPGATASEIQGGMHACAVAGAQVPLLVTCLRPEAPLARPGVNGGGGGGITFDGIDREAMPDEYSFAVACCCCCCVAGQLWQRVLRKPAWHCVAITVVLWLFAGTWLSSDAVSPASYNYSRLDWDDGELHLEEISFVMGLAFVPFYLLLTSIIRYIHIAYRRDFPQRAQRMRYDPNAQPCAEYYLGCCQLAVRMLATFVPPSRYNACALLPADDDVEAGGPRARAVERAGATPAAGNGGGGGARPAAGGPRSIVPAPGAARPAPPSAAWAAPGVRGSGVFT